MIDPRQPLYQWGQRVRAAADLVNDGSYPGLPPEALLAAAGTAGEIINVGHHAESNSPVYLVEFDSQMVVGCLEDELARL